jgi:hypothetical protein
MRWRNSKGRIFEHIRYQISDIRFEMNRREALHAVSLLFGGTIVGSQAFLAGCAEPAPDVEPFVGVLENEDEMLLDEVGETIIPATEDSPGAKAAGVGVFMNEIVTDCYSPREQQLFRAGLLRIDAKALEEHGRTFVELDSSERHAFLLTLEEESRAYGETHLANAPEVHYYAMIKQLTVWGYLTSEVGATQALRYLPVPGSWEACIPYAQGEKAFGPV